MMISKPLGESMPFCTLLREERESFKLRAGEAARRSGVSENVYLAWERGEERPSRLQLRKIFGTNTKLLFHLPEAANESPASIPSSSHLTVANAPRAAADLAKSPYFALRNLARELGILDQGGPGWSELAQALSEGNLSLAAIEIAQALKVYDRARLKVRERIEDGTAGLHATFGSALMEARERCQLTQAEVGILVGVTGQAVSWWETERNVPVKPNYDELLDLFPELRYAPEPDWKDIAVPQGGKDTARSADTMPRPRTALALLPLAAPSPSAAPETSSEPFPQPSPTEPAMTAFLALFERTLALFAELHGQKYRIVFESSEKGVWIAEAHGDKKYMGAGADPHAALIDLVSSVRGEIERRKASLDALLAGFPS